MQKLFAFLSLFFSIHSAQADFEIPRLVRPVMDEAQLLQAQDVVAVERAVLNLNAVARLQMAILITPSLNEKDIETFSMEVAEKWGLGKKGVDNGLLLVIAPRERKLRFEVGYGLEGELTDALTRRILDQNISPYFRQERFRDGLISGVTGVANALGVALDVSIAKKTRRHVAGVPLSPLLFLLLVIIAILSRMMRGHAYPVLPGHTLPRRRSGFIFGGGGFGGGFGGGGFGGGGGRFGGGGSSSSW